LAMRKTLQIVVPITSKNSAVVVPSLNTGDLASTR
jgi:hypothetical protein